VITLWYKQGIFDSTLVQELAVHLRLIFVVAAHSQRSRLPTKAMSNTDLHVDSKDEPSDPRQHQSHSQAQQAPNAQLHQQQQHQSSHLQALPPLPPSQYAHAPPPMQAPQFFQDLLGLQPLQGGHQPLMQPSSLLLQLQQSLQQAPPQTMGGAPVSFGAFAQAPFDPRGAPTTSALPPHRTYDYEDDYQSMQAKQRRQQEVAG
jgi:hypothetical protein